MFPSLGIAKEFPNCEVPPSATAAIITSFTGFPPTKEIFPDTIPVGFLYPTPVIKVLYSDSASLSLNGD